MTAVDVRSPRARIEAALMAAKAGDRDRASALVAALVEDDPPLGASWGSVSRLAMTLGETALAVAAAGRHASLDKSDLAARLNHAALLARHGQGAAALGSGLAMVADHPGQPAAWHFLASCRATLGQQAASVADFRQAIARSPDPFAVAASWLALAEARRFEAADDGDLTAMAALLDRWPGERAPAGRAALLYAVGKARDDLGQTDAAFAAYAEGAALMAAARPFDQAGTDAFVNAVIAGTPPGGLEALPTGSDSARPIFVLGPPRSGTTLVEQILVSHSAVVDGAELNLFRTAAMPIGGLTPDAIAAFAAARPDGFARIGQAYLHMLEARFGSEGRVVDKTLNHSRFLGLIHRVFPEARFIWLQRDPGAVAWSCFRTWFAQGVDWSWSLESIAEHLNNEDRLHQHWTSVMGEAILTVPYESLVRDPAEWIGRMLRHVDLPFEPGLEAFHQTERAVTTASYAQVRRPIYASSTDAWQRYRSHLAPFFERYGHR